MKWDYLTYLAQPTFYIKELKDFFKKKFEAEKKSANGRRTT